MTEIEKTIRLYFMWMIMTIGYASGSCTLAIFGIVYDSEDALSVAFGMAIIAFLCFLIAFHYARIVKGMKLLEDLTWESERI